jgi:hypothetical protein
VNHPFFEFRLLFDELMRKLSDFCHPVAEAHVLALTVPEAVGNRFIISQGPFCKQQLSEGVLAIAPETPNVPKGKAGAVQEANDLSKIVTSSGAKAEKILGIKYRSVEETVKDSKCSKLLSVAGWVSGMSTDKHRCGCPFRSVPLPRALH